MDEFERNYRAVTSRDGRFDGWFFTAVTSTGIYCRPSCPARTPKRANVRFYPTAAAAQSAGYRACRRCRPDAVPGSPAWNYRADVVARAMRAISDGVVDRDGVTGLAHRLGYSERHLHRLLLAEVGAGPLALARAQRATTARVLIETTPLPFAEAAFAAGFSSIRQFNDTVREVFATTPSDLRRRAAGSRPAPAPGQVTLRLAFRPPLAGAHLLRWLGRRAIDGVEECAEGGYRRTLRLPHAAGVAELRLDDHHVRCRLQLDDLRDLAAAVQRCRWLLDLDADPATVDEHLGADPILRDRVRLRPGLRVAHSVDGFELAVRAVLGQQVSVAGARTLARRLVTRLGKPLGTTNGTLTHVFPEAASLAEADLGDLGLPQSRAAALRRLAAAVADGNVDLDATAERGETTAALNRLPGIGPWTSAYIAMRALGDPDAFPATDLGLRKAGARLGAGGRDLAGTAQQWQPWRSYAAEHLWATLEEQ